MCVSQDWWSGPAHKSYVLVDRLYDTDLGTVAKLCGNLSTYTIYYMVLDKLKLMLHRAVFTFRELAKDIAEAEQPSGITYFTESFVVP